LDELGSPDSAKEFVIPQNPGCSDPKRLLTFIRSNSPDPNQLYFITTTLAEPKIIYRASVKDSELKVVAKEKVPEGVILDTYADTFLVGEHLESSFVFSSSNLHNQSPVLVWFSDVPDFDVYNPILEMLLKRDFAICTVKIKSTSSGNLKEIIQEFERLAVLIAMKGFSEKINLITEGPLSGLAGLSGHLKNLGVFSTSIFIDPLTDLLEWQLESKGSEYGYGQLDKQENIDRLLEDSPYQSDNLKHLQNTLFVSSTHQKGYPAMKLFSKAKHLIPDSSNVFWVNNKKDYFETSLLWMSFLFKNIFNAPKMPSTSENVKKT
jgi:hypothetical protein